MRKLTSVFTSLLSTTLRRPATYPNKRPTKIGTSELAKRSIIRLLVLLPLRFELAAHQNGSLSYFERSLRFESIAKIEGATARVLYGCDQFVLHLPNLLLGWLLRAVNMK